MMARTLLRTAVAALCAFVFTASIASAQTNTFDRISIIEEFTSATCPPCVPADPVLAAVVKLEDGVVSVRYHMNWPAPNDPFHDANVTDNQARRNFYSVNSIPTSRVNGKATVDPRNESALRTQISADAGAKAPCKITVKQQGGEVEVTVQTSADVMDATLHVAVINRHVSLPDLPNTLPNSNGQDEFADAMMRMLPTAAGTPINIGGNSTETFRFPTSLGAGELWPDDEATVVAFIQKNSGNREVVQAGALANPSNEKEWATLKATAVQVTADSPKFDLIERGATKNRVITVKNKGSVASTVQLSVANTDLMEQLGWTVTITPNTLDLTPGQTLTAQMSISVPDDRSVLAPVEIGVSATDGMGKAVDPVYFLIDGARVALYTGHSTDSWRLMALGINSSQWSTDYVILPVNAEVEAAYPAADFDATILPIDVYARFTFSGTVFDMAKSVLDGGKHLWMATDWLGTILENPQNPYAEQAEWMHNTVGVDVTKYTERVTFNSSGQITAVKPFTSYGTDGDILNGMEISCNQYNQQTWPYYLVFTDILAKYQNSKAKPFLYYDNDPSQVGGMRNELQNGARVVWTSLGFDGVKTLADRVDISDKVIDFLLNGIDEDPTSVETDVTSENGAVALKLTGVNPVVDGTSFTVASNGTAPITVSVVDVLGRTVGTLFNGTVTGTTTVNMDAAALGNGTYSVVASNGTESAAVTVVVAK
jgi:hypothetical protein